MPIVTSEYRNAQALKLKNLLKTYIENPDNLSSDSISPIGSSESIKLINGLIESQNFVIVPVNSSDDQTYTHFYTIGLWYFWNIPEIVIKFEKPIQIINTQIVNLIYDIIVNKMLEIDYNHKTVTHESILIDLDIINSHCEMTLIKEDEYLDIQAIHMMWFYMFYAKAEKNADNQPLLYPVYLINLDQDKYTHLEFNIKKLIDQSYFDNEESIGPESDTDNEESNGSDP